MNPNSHYSQNTHIPPAGGIAMLVTFENVTPQCSAHNAEFGFQNS